MEGVCRGSGLDGYYAAIKTAVNTTDPKYQYGSITVDSSSYTFPMDPYALSLGFSWKVRHGG